jgi:hypothetical protein
LEIAVNEPFGMQALPASLIPELLAQDALVEAVAGVEQHPHRDRLVGSMHLDARTSRTSSWSATAATGRLSPSSTSMTTRAVSGSSAPRQRRGRNGLIGVSASSAR